MSILSNSTFLNIEPEKFFLLSDRSEITCSLIINPVRSSDDKSIEGYLEIESNP